MARRNQLTARSEFSDTRVADVARIVGCEPGAHDAPQLLLLIHGYQNSVKKAHKSFDRMRSGLRSLSPTGDLERFGAVWEYHWPGDHPVWAVSVMSYVARPGDARDSGVLLANHLSNEVNRNQTVHIVAHSLGCLVALHALYTIRGYQANGSYRGPSIGHVFLMAAAVPEPQCRPEAGRRYRAALQGSKEHVFHSRNDHALGSGFRVMQWHYGETGVAVGREGLPDWRWDSVENTHLGHSDYWGSREVATSIASVLAPASGRTLPQRDPAAAPEAREERELAQWRLDVRNIRHAV